MSEKDYTPLAYPPETILTRKQVADWLQVSERTVEAWPLPRLRLVDNYGATTGHQQYQGFKRLPGAGGTSEERDLSPDEAARALIAQDPTTPANGDRAGLAGVMLTVPSVARMIVRNAVKATHPDTGGSAEAFAAVQRARAVLAKHLGAEL